MKKLFFLFLFSTSGLFSFYLSTERSFSPEENAKIIIESSYEKSVDVRLYEIKDIKKFLSSAKELDRIYFGDSTIKENPTFLLFNYLNKSKDILREMGKRVFGENRNLKEDIKNKNIGLLEKKDYPKRKILKKLNYKVIQEFSVDLESNFSGWSYRNIDFGKLPPGLYIAEVYSDPQLAYTLILVSENSLVVKKSDKELFVMMVNKKTGEFVPANIEIFDYKTGKKIDSGNTTSEKPFVYKLKDDEITDFLVLGETKSKNKEKVFYKFSIFPSPKLERMVYIYTDSPVYRSKSDVNIKMVIRDYEDGKYKIPKDLNFKCYIINPLGTKYDVKITNNIDEYGACSFNFSIPANATKGFYKIVCVIDGKDYIGEFRVEEYVAPAFAVNVSTTKKILGANEGKIDFTVNAKYYSGEVVKKGEVEYGIFRTPMSDDIFETTKDVFEDPSYVGRIEFVVSGKGKLNSKGELRTNYNFGKVDRDYVYIIRAKVIDDAYSQNVGSTRIRVVNSFVFLKANFSKMVYKVGEKVSLRVSARFADGKKAIGQEISYEAISQETKALVAKGKVKTDKEGNAVINFKASHKGYLSVVLSTADQFGNKSQEQVYAWIGSEGATFAYTSGNIIIVCDKDEYKVGEKASIYIVSPVNAGSGLITVERESIFNYQIKKFKGNSIFFELPITSELTPNFFFSVIMFANNQTYQQSIKIKVPPKEKVLNVNIKPDKSTYSPRSEANVEIFVSDANNNGVEADVSIAVINEGLYSLFSEISPDPRLFFYSYRWNRVLTYNSTELRFYGYSRNIRTDWSMKIYNKNYWSFNDLRRERFFTSVKESSDLSEEEESVRKDFRDNILWIGSLKTDKDGKASFNFKFPDNIGEFRITAVAFTKDTKVGKDNVKVVSKRNFFVTFNMPINITLYDKALGYLKIFNSDNKNRNVKIEATVEGGKIDLRFKETNIAKNDSVVVPFAIQPTKTGKMKIRVKAIGEGNVVDITEDEITVIPASLPVVFNDSKTLSKGETSFNFNVPSTVINETLMLKLGYIIFENPLTAIMDALLYLKTYPHGCVEQTTSSFLPSLYAMEIANKLEIKLPQDFIRDKDRILTEGVKKLTEYQNTDGSWGWFNEGKVDTFMTAYVMSAFNFVRRINYDQINSTVYNKGIAALTKAVDMEQNINLKIYALYVLSEAKVKFVNMLRNLMSKYKAYDINILSLFALTLKNSGLEKEALEIANYIETLAISEKDKVYWKSKYSAWYDNEIYTTALALRALISVKKESALIPKAVFYLLQNRKDFRWGSTLTTANVVYTLSEYLKTYNVKKAKKNFFELYVNNEKFGSYEIDVMEAKNSLDIPVKLVKTGQNIIRIKGDDNILFNLNLKYHNEGVNQLPMSNNIIVNRTFYKITDKKNIEKVDKMRFKPMDIVLVELEVAANRNVDYLVIEDGIPGGFKPVYDLNAYNNLGIKFFEGIIHREYARGRANIYIHPLLGGKRKYYYLIQAVYPGKYIAFCTYASAMYNEEINASSQNVEFEILEN